MFVYAPGQVSFVTSMNIGINRKIPIKKGNKILLIRSLIKAFIPLRCKTSSAKKPASSMNNCIRKKCMPITANVLMESLLCSPAIQWNELTSQKNIEIWRTTPNIMATALTKSNPWYRSCLSMLIQLPICEVLQAVKDCSASIIPSINIRPLFHQ